MNRIEWVVAWRYARRVYRAGTNEIEALTQAGRELGRPLPLASSGLALRLRWVFKNEPDALHFLRARRREHEFCKYNRR